MPDDAAVGHETPVVPALTGVERSRAASHPTSPPGASGSATALPNLEALRQLQLFRGISESGLTRIARIAREEHVALDAVIFREGDLGDRLYLILEGQVRISRQVSGMGEEALAVLSAGDAFGEMSIIDDVPRSADAIAHTACRLLVIGKPEMEDLLLVHRDLSYEILWNFVRLLTSRLRETNDKMTFLSVTARF